MCSLSLRVTLLLLCVHVNPFPPQSFFLPIIGMMMMMTTGTITPQGVPAILLLRIAPAETEERGHHDHDDGGCGEQVRR